MSGQKLRYFPLVFKTHKFSDSIKYCKNYVYAPASKDQENLGIERFSKLFS